MHPAQIALRCLDLTSLKDDDTEATIEALACRANTPHGAPAALCVYTRFVRVALEALVAQDLAQVRVATVVSFPHGASSPDEVAREIDAALAAGADEIDAVLPWRALRAADPSTAVAFATRCRRECAGAALKFILETGELRDPALIAQASRIALDAGADFLKTSTGKVSINATPEAVAVMLDAIRATGARAGLKVAGGLATLADVQGYVAQAAAIYGEDRLSPDTLRFGASSLLPVLLAALDGASAPSAATGY
ncbi:MAG TPA: deoxyribose-phosphate aldolase [Albitalea sp.]|uniref:deoxyribose-phosphate aldolase n=1 Tax=Piscinibacter sp. TaxID=1903157 RepID=UPI002ED5B3CF